VNGLRACAAALACVALFGATSAQLDSEYVLQRYQLAIETLPTPKAVIFTYSVSQAGPNNIEQRHRIYRSGMSVRDETISVDGEFVSHKSVRFYHREDRYSVSRFAPRTDAYELLFLTTVTNGHHLDYVYDATPLSRAGGVWVDRLTIDGVRYLPRIVRFHSVGPDARGTAVIQFAPFGRYWMPVAAEATALVNGKPARERITWGDYRFPDYLPPSTFEAPQALPQVTLPPT
jgi:hypothetical protein